MLLCPGESQPQQTIEEECTIFVPILYFLGRGGGITTSIYD